MLIADTSHVMTCAGRNRKGKMAREIADKGCCSTKHQYYHGLKMHLVEFMRKEHISFPHPIILFTTSENDLTVFKGNALRHLEGRQSSPRRYTGMLDNGNNEGARPKATVSSGSKGCDRGKKQRNKVANDLFSSTVSSVRVPAEAFFSRLKKRQTFKGLICASLLPDS